MSADFPSRSLDKVIVRLPDGMRDRLAAVAKANGRSSNAEIVARLQASLNEHEPDNPFVRVATEAQNLALRELADDLEAVVEQFDKVIGAFDHEAWRKGAYSITEGDEGQTPANGYEPGTAQFASWVAGRAFAVAAELKRTIRQVQGIPGFPNAQR